MSDRSVYMDNNATTPLHPQVREEMTGAMSVYGNASSFHSFGREARARVEEARAAVAALIGAQPDEIIFTGSGSEANNTVLNIFAMRCGKHEICAHQGGRDIVTTRIEHPCIMETARCLEQRDIPVRYAGVDATGKLRMDELAAAVTRQTGLVSVMLANNEIGTLQDIAAIAKVAHTAGAVMHTDAVQAVGKIPVDVNALGVDFLSLSAHKIYGPKGVGALYIRKGTPFCPLIRGGHQEKGRRAGTENTLGIIGLGAAAMLARAEMTADALRLRRLRDRLREGLLARVPDVHVNGHPSDCLPGTVNISFDGAEGEAILLYLDLEGIAVSTGSACSSGSLEPSHVLLATGLAAERAHGSIRFSLGRENSDADVDHVLDRLPKVIAKIRGMSTAYQRKR
jgi:cysteine desulfurase